MDFFDKCNTDGGYFGQFRVQDDFYLSPSFPASRWERIVDGILPMKIKNRSLSARLSENVLDIFRRGSCLCGEEIYKISQGGPYAN